MEKARPTIVPSMEHHRQVGVPSKALRDFFWLLRGELFLLREAWFWYLFQASFVPVSYLLFLWFLVGSAGSISFFVTGSLVTSLSFGGMLSVGQHLGMLKDSNAFEYYATLPISKSVFVAALATRGMLLSLPSTVIVLVFGYLIFGLVVPFWASIILLLSAYAMAGIGAFIGFWSPTAQIASLATQVLQTIIIFFAPVFFPLEALPIPLQFTSYLWPTTYAAYALRGAIEGASLSSLWPSILALVAFTVVSLVLVPLKLDWRGR